MMRRISKKLSIILVDDDVDDRKIFGEALAEIVDRYELKTFESGEEVVDYLENFQGELPDLLFLDVNMPLMGGLEALSKIRKELGLMSLPIAMYSTSSLESDITSALVAGANVYIRKPSHFDKLKDALHRVLLMKLNYEHRIHDFVLSV